MKVNLGKYHKHSNRRHIDVQIDRWDTWSLDHSLALIIYPALLQLKGNMPGVPMAFTDVGGDSSDDQKSFDFYAETYHEMVDLSSKKWEEIIDKMIWSFQQLILEDYTDRYFHITIPSPGKPDYTTVKALSDPNSLCNDKSDWVDYVGLKLHDDRIAEGLELFGKYYRSLWE